MAPEVRTVHLKSQSQSGLEIIIARTGAAERKVYQGGREGGRASGVGLKSIVVKYGV